MHNDAGSGCVVIQPFVFVDPTVMFGVEGLQFTSTRTMSTCMYCTYNVCMYSSIGCSGSVK